MEYSNVRETIRRKSPCIMHSYTYINEIVSDLTSIKAKKQMNWTINQIKEIPSEKTEQDEESE